MSATAWVVECLACKCVIVAFAIDPQGEHGSLTTPSPPQDSCVLQCLCCGSAARYTAKHMSRDVPKRNPVCLRKQGKPMDGAVLIASTIVAAIRLRGEEVKPSPKVTAVVADSIQLAKMVLARMER
jgi:hypothetical protein